jgi:hypothetical protein
VLPYQLGYHPSDSLVLCALRGGRLGMIERIDLPPPEHVAEACSSVVAPMVREDPDGVLLVGYEAEAGASMPLSDAVRDELAECGIGVIDRMVVRHGCWSAPDCRSGCCPTADDPQPVARDVPALADFVALEVAPLQGRDDLAALVQAEGDLVPEVAALLAARGAEGCDAEVRGRGHRATAVHRLRRLATWALVLDVGVDARPVESLTAEDVAHLVDSLLDVGLRDAVIAWLCPGTLPMELLPDDLADAVAVSLPAPVWAERGGGDTKGVVAGRRLLARLQWVVRAVPDDAAAPVLTVLANYAWWLGDGALTRVALDRALAHDPGYRLARLLERMVDLGLRSPSEPSAGVPA